MHKIFILGLFIFNCAQSENIKIPFSYETEQDGKTIYLHQTANWLTANEGGPNGILTLRSQEEYQVDNQSDGFQLGIDCTNEDQAEILKNKLLSGGVAEVVALHRGVNNYWTEKSEGEIFSRMNRTSDLAGFFIFRNSHDVNLKTANGWRTAREVISRELFRFTDYPSWEI